MVMSETMRTPWELLDELSGRIRVRREEAERLGDEDDVVRLRAMAAVLDTKLIAIACPDAVVIAGEAARAAHQGESEPEWYAEAYVQRGPSADDLTQLNTAVRLLRSAGLWPWPAGVP